MFYLSFILIALVSVILPVDTASAQVFDFVTCEGPDCNACHIVNLVNEVIRWLFFMVGLIFAIMMMIAGFGLVTSGGDTAALSKAKEKFRNVIIGLIIAMAAWLLIDTLMRGLMGGGSVVDDAGNPVPIGEIRGWGPWAEVQCFRQEQPQRVIAGNGVTEVDYSKQTTPGVVSPGSLGHNDALSRLNNSGIIVTSTQGPDGVNLDCTGISRCTSLNNIREDTVNQTINISNGCPECRIVVTGGTEGGHSGGEFSHGAGYKIDLDDNPTLDKFLTENLERDGQRGGSHGGPRYRDSCGNEYVRENNHWDISITNGACDI